jgi:hypothetical protein
MKRKLIAFSTTMALLLSVFSAATVGAHTTPIEFPDFTASRGDWFGVQSDGSGIGIVQRNASQQGEFIFNDASKDQRLITTTDPVTRETDLDWFGVTGDANAIYFVAKVDNYSGIANNPSLELLITVDTTQNGAGTVDLPLVQASGTYSTTKVSNDAAWEFAVRTTFPSGAPGQKNCQRYNAYSYNGIGQWDSLSLASKLLCAAGQRIGISGQLCRGQGSVEPDRRQANRRQVPASDRFDTV